MHSYSWLKGTKSIEEVIWFHFTSFSKAFGLMGCGQQRGEFLGVFSFPAAWTSSELAA